MQLSAFFGVQDKARKSYQGVVHEHAGDGWRLVQIFAPGVAAFGAVDGRAGHHRRDDEGCGHTDRDGAHCPGPRPR